MSTRSMLRAGSVDPHTSQAVAVAAVAVLCVVMGGTLAPVSTPAQPQPENDEHPPLWAGVVRARAGCAGGVTAWAVGGRSRHSTADTGP